MLDEPLDEPALKPAVAQIAHRLWPAVFALASVQITVVVNTLLASLLPAGTVSHLYYADRVMEFPLGIFGIALATAALPAAVSVGVSHRWCCWRPHHPDGLPVIDQIPGLDNAWLTSGHYRTGLLMGPATADLLVEWITTGRRPPSATPFAAARFSPDRT